jgi:SAM-dependent methyltransferase
MDRSDPAYRGQADYGPLLLRLYDPIVIRVLSRAFWRFPPDRLPALYRANIRDRHLDVGPGTGYLLDHSGIPDGRHITIVDPNPNVLRHATKRLSRLDVTAIEADVLKPLPVEGPFDSAALCLVLHCLPGPMTRKATAVANIAAVLAPDGVFFGASVLGRSGDHPWLGRRALAAFNRRGAFDNLDDSADGIREILSASFETVQFETFPSIVVFTASTPRAGWSGTPARPG